MFKKFKKIEPKIGLNPTANSEEKLKKTTENLYVGEAGRREWNDRYGLMAYQTRLWQGAFGAAMVVVLALTVVVVKVSNESTIKAFAVETNQGVPISMHPMEALGDSSVNEQQIINYALNEFIIGTRGVLGDNEAEKNVLAKVYAFASEKALIFLNGYYKEAQNNPFEKVAKTTTQVTIVNTLSLSPHTAQVIWDETERDSMSGEIISKNRWIASMTYKRGPVNAQIALLNPFGIYITDLSWSKNQS